MPGWLRQKLTDMAEDIADDVVNQVQSQVMTQVANVDLGPTLDKLKDTGLKCNGLAQETTSLCKSTESISSDMEAIGQELLSTLTGVSDGGGGVQADAFDTIQELLSGEKLHSAMDLAKNMDEQAMTCVNKSVEMISLLENALDDLPDPLEKAIDAAMQNQQQATSASSQEQASASPLETLSTMDKDMEDVRTCIDAIGNLNLFTALDVGVQAFSSFSQKVNVSRSAFAETQRFSNSIVETTNAFCNLDLVNIIQHVKELWKCLKLTNVMKKLAQGVGNLIQLVIDLFQATSTKVAGLWKALAYAKDCMADCATTVQETKELVTSATNDSTTLIEQSRSIKEQMEHVGELNASSITAVQELADGEEINSAIGIAEQMDDVVLQCVNKSVNMITRLQEGYANLPPIVTEGIPPEAGTSLDDPPPANVEENIEDLETCTRSIQDANVFSAVNVGVRGFSDVADKMGIAKELLSLIEGFSTNCLETIDSFMGVWDLATATEKIKSIRRMTTLGEMMKQFSEQIKRLVLAVIALMKSAVTKLSNLDLKDITENFGEHVDDAVDMVKNMDIGKIGSQFKKFF